MRRIAVAALWLMSLPAMAVDVPVSWVNATKAVDGSDITPQSTTVVWGPSAAALSNSQTTNTKTVALPATSTTVPLSPGVVYLAAYHTAASGKSVLTNTVQVTVPEPVPQPPTGLTVTVPVAYTLVKQRDSLAMVVVGDVPVGTQCVAGLSVTTTKGSYNVVPRASVTFNGTVRPEVVFALCS